MTAAVPGPARSARVEVDLGAIRHNVAWLARTSAPATVCAVVKADGYGHGAPGVARAALEAGASMLAVALVEEGERLRGAGITAPVLLLSEPDPAAYGRVVAAGLAPAVYSAAGIRACADAAAAAGTTCDVHLKVDTGMRRVGCAPDDVVALARAVAAEPSLRLAAVWTHLAVADEPTSPFTALQLERFEQALGALRAAGLAPPLVHAANSAAAVAFPEARYGMVRCGIAVYGIAPSAALRASYASLRPALRLVASVSHTKVLRAGEGISYGLRHVADDDVVVATLPLGYADGVPRRLSATGGEALVGGRRCPIVGVVTMDQMMVACGPPGTAAGAVRRGDEAVLLGAQGAERIGPEDWAERLGTIAYEVVCGLSARLPRVVSG